MRSMLRSVLAVTMLVASGTVLAQTGDVAQPVVLDTERDKFLHLLEDARTLARWMTNEPAFVAVLAEAREQIADADPTTLAPLHEFEPHFSHLGATLKRMRVRLDPVQAATELCDPNRSDELFLLYLDTLDAEGQREVSARICERLAAVEGEPGTPPPVCFGSHLVFLAVRAMRDLVALCDPDLARERGAASAEGFDQVRSELAGVNAEVQQSVRTAKQDLTRAMTVVAGHVSEVSSLNTTNLKSTIQEGLDHTFRLEIEKALEAGKSYGVVYLPEAHGGQLETVRRIVIETIGNVRDSGEASNGASAKLAAGDEELVKGHYKKAFRLYSEAYVAAVGTGGKP